MEVELEPVPFEQKATLRHLLELCQHDYSEFDGTLPGDEGLFGYRYLDHYWTEPGRYPFFIRAGGRLAGFALVRLLQEAREEPLHTVAEFFVLRAVRRQGIGEAAARRLFERFGGLWEVSQEAGNLPSQSFWRRVIGDYTGGQAEEVKREGWEGPTQRFRAPPGERLT